MRGLLPSILMREVDTETERHIIFVPMYILQVGTSAKLLNDFCKAGELTARIDANRVPG